MAMYNDNQLEDIKRAACTTGSDEATLKARSMAVIRLGYAICSDDLTDKKRWELTQTLATQCFGKEENESIRSELADTLGAVSLSGYLDAKQGMTLFQQTEDYLEQKTEKSLEVKGKLAYWLQTVSDKGMIEIYGFQVSSNKNHPVVVFNTLYGLQQNF